MPNSAEILWKCGKSTETGKFRGFAQNSTVCFVTTTVFTMLLVLSAGDDRTMQTRSRLRKKLGQRRACDNSNTNNSNTTQNSTKISTAQKSTANGLCCCPKVLAIANES